MNYKLSTAVLCAISLSSYAAKSEQPNVLLIMADQHNADIFGFMGHPDVKTPNFDRLVEDGLFYSRSYCQDAVSVPSRTSMITGQYCSDNQVLANGDRTPLTAFYYKTLHEKMSDEGYITACMGKRHLPMGFELGFDKTATTISPTQDPSDENYPEWINSEGKGDIYKKDFAESKHNQMCASISEMPLSHRTSTYARSKTIEFIESVKKGDKPFFCWTSFIFPHQPYCPIPEFLEQYDLDKITLPESLRQEPAELPRALANQRKQTKSPWCLGLAAEDESLYRKYMTYYYALVSEVDFQVGELIKYLKAEGLYDNTIIIYVSDHGDFVGGHGMIEKCAAGHNVYEETLRIPMIIKPHSGYKFKSGERKDLVQMIDLYPTLLDMVGAKNEVPNLDGLSLAQNIKSGKAVGHKYVVSESYIQRTIVTDFFKYGEWIRTPETEPKVRFNVDMLFSNADDPTEQNNLIDDVKYAAKIEEMKGYLDEFSKRENPFWVDIKFTYKNPSNTNAKVTSSITLPERYKGCKIKWSSSHPEIVSTNGIVDGTKAARPFSLVKLSAEITKGGKKESCNFAFKIMPKNPQQKR